MPCLLTLNFQLTDVNILKKTADITVLQTLCTNRFIISLPHATGAGGLSPTVQWYWLTLHIIQIPTKCTFVNVFNCVFLTPPRCV